MVITQQLDRYNAFFILLGTLGALTTFSGIFLAFPQPYYIIGSFFLFIAAFRFKLYFFMALEIILFSGHLAILLGIGTILQIALPTLLCGQLMFFYMLSEKKINLSIIIGIIGIGVISIGLSIDSQWIFLIGSTGIASYAFVQLKKTNYVTSIWLILNILFAFTALVRILAN